MQYIVSYTQFLARFSRVTAAVLYSFSLSVDSNLSTVSYAKFSKIMYGENDPQFHIITFL